MSQASSPKSERETSLVMVIGSVAVLLLLASLDQTIVATALPTIVADLGAVDHLSWVVSAYLLASTVVAPIYGKLGDLYGRKVIILLAISLFLLGSALAGLAQSMTFLILSRALQGLGGGGLFVLAFSTVADVVPPRERGKYQGAFGGIFSFSSVAGPLIGGYFVEHLSWHWIFYVNLPLGLLALAGFGLGFRNAEKRVSHKIDYAGAGLLAVTLAATVMFTSFGGRTFPWSSPQALGLGALALAGLAGLIFVERRAAEPILPPALFRIPTFRVATGIGFVAGVSMFGAITFLPLYLQVVKGSTPSQSGLQLLPLMFGILLSSTTSGQIMSRTGRYKFLPIVGTAIVVCGMLSLSTLGTDTNGWQFSTYMAIVGIGMGPIMGLMTTVNQNAVPPNMIGVATAGTVLFRQIGGSTGVAVFGAIFGGLLASTLSGQLPEGFDISGLNAAMLKALPDETRIAVLDAVVAALHPVFILAAFVAFGAFILSWMLEEKPLRTTTRDEEPQAAE